MFSTIQFYTSIQKFESQEPWARKHTELSLMATKQSMYHEMQGLSVNAAATTHKMNTPHSFLIS